MDSLAARRAGEMMEAILVAPMLRPLIDGAGTLGEYELDLLAREIAHDDVRGFASVVASQLERLR